MRPVCLLKEMKPPAHAGAGGFCLRYPMQCFENRVPDTRRPGGVTACRGGGSPVQVPHASARTGARDMSPWRFNRRREP